MLNSSSSSYYLRYHLPDSTTHQLARSRITNDFTDNGQASDEQSKSLVPQQTLHVHVGLRKMVQEQASFHTARNLDVWGTDIGGVRVRTHSPWQMPWQQVRQVILCKAVYRRRLNSKSIDFILIRHIRPSETSLRPSKKPVPQQTSPA